MINFCHSTVSPTSLQDLQPVIERIVANNSTDFTVLLRVVSLKSTALRLRPQNESVVQNGFTYYDPTDRILR